MKVYTGWVLMIKGIEFTVIGSMKIRSSQSYILKFNQGKTSVRRTVLLEMIRTGEAKYVRSEVV